MCLHLQILVDISTPKSVFEALEKRVRQHLLDNPLDFTGDCAITMDKNPTIGNEPLKVVIMIYWCYKFNGAPPPGLLACLAGSCHAVWCPLLLPTTAKA